MAVSLDNFITPVVTVVAVLLTSQLAYGRGNKEKVWDLRRQAYGVILSELAAVDRVCDRAADFMQEDFVRYFHTDYYREHNGQISTHMAVVDARYSSDYLILSDAFLSLFEGFRVALAAGTPNDDPPEEHDRFVGAVKHWRPLLLAQARSEMPLSRTRWSLRRSPGAQRQRRKTRQPRP
jgi:hypothetical protein